MAVTRQEIENVMGPWGAKILGEIDQYLGDNDGWIENADFYISSGTTYSDDKNRTVQQCLDYCNRFKEKNLFDNNPSLLANLEKLSQTPTGKLPDAKLFHDTAIACIASASSVREDQILKCLRDYDLIPEGKSYTPDKNKIQVEAKQLEAARKKVVDFEDPTFKKMTDLPLFDSFVTTTSSTSEGDHIFGYTTYEFKDVSPKQLLGLITSPDFYYCSKFSDDHVEYFATLQEVNDPSTLDILSITNFFLKDVVMLMRQQVSYDEATQEYRVKIYALPPPYYSNLFKNLGYKNNDGKVWTEWRIRSNGDKGSQVALIFSTESSFIPDVMQKKIAEAVIGMIFNTYTQGLQTITRTRAKIKAADAWEIPQVE